MNTFRALILVCFLIGLYYFVYYLYNGLLHPIPTLGDDWDYHIPISLAILDGSFLNPPCYSYYPRFYPGAAEAINSMLILLHVPLTISSLFAIIALSLCCYQLGRTFNLQEDFSILFALTFSTLTVVLRWANKVSIDVWLSVFFILSIILLEKIKKSTFQFIALGFSMGMLLGSKYTGLIFVIILLLFYGKKIVSTINPIRILAFLIPFFIFGLFWYVRNYFVIHNPLIPLCTTGSSACINMENVLYLWQETIKHPLVILNAFFGEYKLWTFLPGSLILYFFWKKKIKLLPYGFIKLSLLGLAILLFYFTLPTSRESWQTVSTIRYTLPAFAPMMLAFFMLAQAYRKDTLLGFFVIANMLPTLSMAYYPKLLFIYFPIVLIILYYYDKNLLKMDIPSTQKVLKIQKQNKRGPQHKKK